MAEQTGFSLVGKWYYYYYIGDITFFSVIYLCCLRVSGVGPLAFY